MDKKLKLNYKNTMLISLAFFSILMLWQVYNTYCPLFLSDLLHLDQESWLIGIFMASDNILALILLPLFGRLSDKTKTRFGKRMPYIITGMITAALIFPLIPFFYIKGVLAGVIVMMFLILCVMHMYRTPAVSLMPDITPKPLRSKANGIINLVGYFGPIIAAVVKMFLDYKDHPYIPFFIASIFLLAAALILVLTVKENELLNKVKDELILGEELSQTLEKVEEDKPLSKGDKKNLIILLVATFIWYMAFNALESFLSLYCKNILGDEKLSGTVTIILTISSVLTFIPSGILANKLGRKLSVLIGIGCLFVGFFSSAIITPSADIRKHLVFNQNYINIELTNDNYKSNVLTLKDDGTFVLIENNYKHTGKYKLNEHYVSLDGEDVYTYYQESSTYKASIDKTFDSYKAANKAIIGYKVMFFVFVAVAGIGWAMINVSSYPMVTELASQSNIGRISSLYYLASMLAQSVTPVLIGSIMAFATGYKGLFWYSTILTILAFIIFMLYKENKIKVNMIKKGILESFDND